MRLIQDLLAKSVAKWSGDGEPVKVKADENKTGLKMEEKNTKVEYTETDPHDVKIKKDEIKDENPKIKVKVGLNRKLDDTETDKSRKKKKKAHKGSKYVSCENANDSETDEIQSSDQKDKKSLIMRLLKKSAAKITVGEDDFDHEEKNINIKKIKRKNSKKNKKEINIETETIDSLNVDLKNRLSRVKKETKMNQNMISSGVKIKAIVDKHQEISKRKTNYKKRFFSPEEDEILQHSIDNENINLKDLADQLGRSGYSIRTRISRLKMGDSKFVQKEYSLVEDLLIMDRMLEKLPGKRLEDLEMLLDGTSSEFLTTLGRAMITGPIYRWGVKIKPWILQHYAGTLNLDIKRMLANYIADSFDSFDSIDWALVVKRPEFAGQTLSSLKRLFYSNLFGNTKKKQKLEPGEVTLKNIADETNKQHEVKKKVPEKVLIRQKQVIDYFEQYVKKHSITNFL